MLILTLYKFDDLKAFYPFYRFKEAGIQVIVIGMDEGTEVCTGKYGYKLMIDKSISEVVNELLDGVIMSGGWAPSRLKRCKNILKIIENITDRLKKITATIFHGG